MPQALTDLLVAGRLAARAVGRKLTGQVSPPPDTGAFRQAMDAVLAGLPDGIVSEHLWVHLSANEPPWRDTGLQLRAGEEATYFACGRVYANRPLDIWVTPKSQIWARLGEDGDLVSSSRDSGTIGAGRDGALYLGNYFPNDWADRSGATLQDDAVYGEVEGETLILVVRWAGSAADGLRTLASLGDHEGLIAREIERLDQGTGAPADWHYLWHLGEAEIFSPCESPGGGDAICCAVEGDVGILQKEVSLSLTPDTEISWRWMIETLPGVCREDSTPSHDYLSIAVEFDNGMDITYYWSKSLKPGTGYACPLENWKHREYHVVVRSGEDGLGAWHDERRNLYEDYRHYLGAPPARIVRVWLIANSIFQRRRGKCAYADISLQGSGQSLSVL